MIYMKQVPKCNQISLKINIYVSIFDFNIIIYSICILFIYIKRSQESLFQSIQKQTRLQLPAPPTLDVNSQSLALTRTTSSKNYQTFFLHISFWFFTEYDSR